ncbi:MAG: leucine-rich repeat domain-containing protein [Promethearchaeota archaeon]
MTPLIRNAADELVEAYPDEEEDVTLYLPGKTSIYLPGWKSGREVTAIPEILDLEIVIKKGLKNIERLNLSHTNITEITGLENFPNLKDLDLSRCQITEITGLETLVNLERLKLIENKITEISGLETLIHLKELDLSFNKIAEKTGLETLVNLERLNLELVPLAELPHLKRINKIKILLNQGGSLRYDDLFFFANHASIETLNFFINSHKIHPDNKERLVNMAKRRTMGLKSGFKIYK